VEGVAGGVRVGSEVGRRGWGGGGGVARGVGRWVLALGRRRLWWVWWLAG